MSFCKLNKCARQAETWIACSSKVLLSLVKVENKRGYFNEHPTPLMTAAPNMRSDVPTSGNTIQPTISMNQIHHKMRLQKSEI
jgi:hypothetical protein